MIFNQGSPEALQIPGIILKAKQNELCSVFLLGKDLEDPNPLGARKLNWQPLMVGDRNAGHRSMRGSCCISEPNQVLNSGGDVCVIQACTLVPILAGILPMIDLLWKSGNRSSPQTSQGSCENKVR